MRVSPLRIPIADIRFPEALPVSARRHEIAELIQAHPVVIVCGETGSGKTTQLPKIVMTLGRGLGAGGAGLIGHTQPRRIAASSVAKRIAQELNTPLGDVVGYKVRFQDRVHPGATVKLMTDGILLAETQSDPLLRAYDTLIIDEAHERSLNIDFLLGYLRQLLPRRPDLKVIVTSATIDADRFAAYFASAAGPAPVITVSGRLFPVTLRWRPFEESREADINMAIAGAIDELWRDGMGDVLVFLPGEREIREAADHLRKHFAHALRGGPPAEILPLFARLSQAEQERVFQAGNGRRVVLATNVAETSLTVPGIRYVVDTGVARVKRYSYRAKVEQLQIEPISRAAAAQRAGRCGRVADGICVRLYDETGFGGRPAFTDPEILRSSLAGVILRMKSLGLGRVDDFAFLDPPPNKAVVDGYDLLAELQAVDEAQELTAIGHALARLPLDPRVGRMILAARERDALSEVLIIAAALSVQDARDRPLEHQQAADEQHRKFDDERSEFNGYLKLWRWIEEGRGHATGEPGAVQAVHKLSNRQQEQRLRESFVNPRRVREWRDVQSQLHQVVAEQGWRLNASPATYEQLHGALLAGLLGNIGCKSDEHEHYQGARGIRFWRHPGAHLSRKPGRWLFAAELVETTKLYGRGLAALDPQWLPSLAGHLLKTQLLDPHWEKKAGEVTAFERATLYGLVIYHQRRVNFATVDPVLARDIFIREGLVAGEMETRLAFLSHNQKMIAQVQEVEHKSRRQDVLVDDSLIHAFYDQQLPADVFSVHTLERWYSRASKSQPRLLMLTREELMRHEAAGITTESFPKLIRLGGVDCALSYLHEPSDPADGVTVTVPIYALNQVNELRCDWLVPGMLAAKVGALVKTLPQRARSRLMPLAEFIAEFMHDTPFGQGDLIDALTRAVRERSQLAVQRNDFKLEQISAHSFMNFRVVDEHGRQLASGRQLSVHKAALGQQARGAFQALAALKLGSVTAPTVPIAAPPAAAAKPGRAPPAMAKIGVPEAGFVAWTFGELPELLEISRDGQTLIGFPALIDLGDRVRIEVFDEPDAAARKHSAGLRRLFALHVKDTLKSLEKNLPDAQRLSVLFMPLGSAEELRAQILAVALDRAFLADPLPINAEDFARRAEQGRPRLTLIAQEVARMALAVLIEYAAATRKLRDSHAPKDLQDDVQIQLQRLVPKDFMTSTPWEQMQHLTRYLKAVVLRLEKWRADPARDERLMGELRPLEQGFVRRLAQLKGVADVRMDQFRWQLEELRVGLFAQELRTPQPVSVKRLQRAWQQIAD